MGALYLATRLYGFVVFFVSNISSVTLLLTFISALGCSPSRIPILLARRKTFVYSESFVYTDFEILTAHSSMLWLGMYSQSSTVLYVLPSFAIIERKPSTDISTAVSYAAPPKAHS